MSGDSWKDFAVRNALGEALDAAGVRKDLRAGAVALLSNSYRFDLVGGELLCDGGSVAAMVTDWARGAGKDFMPATDPSGSRPVPPTGGKRRSEMNAAEKGGYIAKYGLAAYEALPA